VEPIEWRDGKVRFLDQTQLPAREITTETDDPLVIVEAIRTLAIRGAPLIGIAAAYAVALAAVPPVAAGKPPGTAADRVRGAMELLAGTRPTAVNLFSALGRMKETLDRCAGPAEIAPRLLETARAIHAEDAAMCAAIGRFGAGLLPADATVITHCNAGALATGGIGTALGVITTASSLGKIRRVYVGETRPLFQGARLTAWELSGSGIDVTVMTDSSAPYLMIKERVDAVIIGADRIAANGDVANKIGSYALARAAADHGIPFYVAAPTTTIDPSLPEGGAIPIEVRAAEELTFSGTGRIVPGGASVWTPAFDVTPHEYVTAIVTENGVNRPPYSFHAEDGGRPGGGGK